LRQDGFDRAGVFVVVAQEGGAAGGAVVLYPCGTEVVPAGTNVADEDQEAVLKANHRGDCGAGALELVVAPWTTAAAV